MSRLGVTFERFEGFGSVLSTVASAATGVPVPSGGSTAIPQLPTHTRTERIQKLLDAIKTDRKAAQYIKQLKALIGDYNRLKKVGADADARAHWNQIVFVRQQAWDYTLRWVMAVK